ncbi:MAG TPA: biotin/lipoyl-containing protein, partial [Agromyces sp.]
MIRDFALPDLGEGLTESEIVAWRVKVGDHVELNQIIADVETAKAVVELPSPFEGTVTALHAAEGETVNVGEKLFSCDTGGGAPVTDAA